LTDGRTAWKTYVVSDSEDSRHVVAHTGVIDSHKRRVEHDAQRYKQVDERIHDEQFDDVGEALPTDAARPVEQDLLDSILDHLLDAQLTTEPPTRDTYTSQQYYYY